MNRREHLITKFYTDCPGEALQAVAGNRCKIQGLRTVPFRRLCKGFTLVELMIVVAIIGILSAVAIPNFLGMQEKSRIRSIMESHSSAKSLLMLWMRTIEDREAGYVDFNGDSVVTGADDTILVGMVIEDIPDQWDAANGPAGKDRRSPFFPNQDLFATGAAAGSGQISITCANKACDLIAYSDRLSDGEIINSLIATD